MSSLSDFNPDEFNPDDIGEDGDSDDNRHTEFKKVMIHTAKCDVCNLHNKSTLRRCSDCGWQICTPCWEERGGSGAHGVSRKFDGPVYTPGQKRAPPPVKKKAKAVSKNESGDESYGAKKASKATKPAPKTKNQTPMRGGETAGKVTKRRAPPRATTQARGKGNASGSNTTSIGQANPVTQQMQMQMHTPDPSQPSQFSTPVARNNNFAGLDGAYTDTESQNQRIGNHLAQAELSPNDPNNPMYWLCKASKLAYQDLLAENHIKTRRAWDEFSAQQYEANQYGLDAATRGTVAATATAAGTVGAGVGAEEAMAHHGYYSPYYSQEGNSVVSGAVNSRYTGYQQPEHGYTNYASTYGSTTMQRHVEDEDPIEHEAAVSRERVPYYPYPNYLSGRNPHAHPPVEDESYEEMLYQNEEEQQEMRGWGGNGGNSRGRPWDL